MRTLLRQDSGYFFFFAFFRDKCFICATMPLDFTLFTFPSSINVFILNVLYRFLTALHSCLGILPHLRRVEEFYRVLIQCDLSLVLFFCPFSFSSPNVLPLARQRFAEVTSTGAPAPSCHLDSRTFTPTT